MADHSFVGPFIGLHRAVQFSNPCRFATLLRVLERSAPWIFLAGLAKAIVDVA